MQEKTAPVFVVMTANRAEVLPAELIRKGRIDEIFWVDLPNHSEREAIFRVHLSRVRPPRVLKGDFDLGMLASRSPCLSGAEIEQVIYDAMQSAFSAGEEFTSARFDGSERELCSSGADSRGTNRRLENLGNSIGC